MAQTQVLVLLMPVRLWHHVKMVAHALILIMEMTTFANVYLDLRGRTVRVSISYPFFYYFIFYLQ